MASRYQRWRALPLRERWQLCVLAIAQPAVSLALRLFGYKSTLRRLERHSQHPSPHPASDAQLAEAERLAQLAAIAGRRGPLQVTCLRQALTIYWLLRRRGLRPELKFGVDRLGSTPDMHAWVELEGVSLGQVNPRHRPFQAIEPSSTASTTVSRSWLRRR